MSLERWVGKVAVVTGASAGIGRDTAETLVKNGMIVAGLARRVDRIKEHARQLTKEKGKLYGFKCDLTSEDEILNTFKQITETLGPIGVLINNAGLAPSTSLINGDIKKWRQIIDTNLLGLTLCTREAINSMKNHGIKGHVININSVLGHVVMDVPNLSVYHATKHGVTAFTESLRLEINRENLPVKITSISPGYVKSDFFTTCFSSNDPIMKEFDDRPGLETHDVVAAIIYALETPEHVNVREITLSVQGKYV